MNNSKISIIVAHDDKRGIGKSNKLLWHISGDLKRFKHLTTGHPIIMGRKTFESIGRILPNRTNIIVTRDQGFLVDGGIMVHSLGDAIDRAKNSPGAEEIFIIGGGEIYKQALAEADKLYLTHVQGDFGAEIFFPEYSEFKKVLSKQELQEGNYRFIFLDLER